MSNTLDDVIKVCENRYGLKVTSKNRNKYVGFLQRQEARERVALPGYDLNQQIRYHTKKKISPYLRLMVDKLFLFSYLTGETTIIAGYEGHTQKKKINSVSDLYLLRQYELGGGISGNLNPKEEGKRMKLRQTDKKLLSLYRSFSNNHYKHKDIYPTWSEAINELGKDKEVIKHFGTKIDYTMVKKCFSPNPLTSSHGGMNRLGKKEIFAIVEGVNKYGTVVKAAKHLPWSIPTIRKYCKTDNLPV